MFMLRRAALLSSAALASLTLSTLHPYPAAGAARSTPERVPAKPLAITYAIKDVGAPPTTSYRYFTQPFGFNATGQLVGEAYPTTAPASSYQHCIAWTGKTWVDLIGSKSLNCYATSGISSANAKGVFATAGGTYVPTDPYIIPYYSTVGPTSATTTFFAVNADANFWAMNETGLAVGNGYYNPVGGFSSSFPPWTSTGTTMTLLQPTCTTALTHCMYYPFYVSGQNGQSRSIDAAGTVFGYAVNQATGQFVEITPGGNPGPVQFSLPTNAGNGPFNIRGINDHGTVVYEEYSPTSKAYFTYLYSPVTRTAASLGRISGSSCTQYTPLYINGAGRVLGLAQSCSFASDQTYWTWDSTYGMHALTFNHTGYSSVTLYLINDKGQIAGDFYTASGVHHWAYLTPPAVL